MTVTIEKKPGIEKKPRAKKTEFVRPAPARRLVRTSDARVISDAAPASAPDMPISFKAPMARKTWQGLKTHTRRLADPMPPAPLKDAGGLSWHWSNERGLYVPCGSIIHLPNSMKGGIESPYKVGQRRWVREPWATERRFDHLKPSDLPTDARVWFEADGDFPTEAGRKRPGMFLPRALSRMTVEISAVRLEHLQGISHEDSLREGIEATEDRVGLLFTAPGSPNSHRTAWCAFAGLWDQINAKGGFGWEERWWWVWAVSFRRVSDGLEDSDGTTE